VKPDPRTEIDRPSAFVAAPLAAAGIAAPIVLERRYRLLVDALIRLRRSRRGRWSVAAGSGLTMAVLALLAAQHFATSSWPLSGGQPGVLVAVCLLPYWAAGSACAPGSRSSLSQALPPRACLVALPRLAGSKRALRFRLGRWLSPRTTSKRRLSEAWALVSACWLLRALASFLLLGTLGVGFSLPLALLLLCAGAAAAAVPIGPAGAATQVGAGAAALIASGVGGSQALAVTLAVGALGVLTGAAIFLAAVVWRAGLSLATSRIGTSGSA
jgi:hypothetical protein